MVFIRVTDPGQYLTDTDPADEKKTDPGLDEILHTLTKNATFSFFSIY